MNFSPFNKLDEAARLPLSPHPLDVLKEKGRLT
jgi:hypothetical protein